MANNTNTSVHQTWQEAAGIAVGVIAALSPFLTGATNVPGGVPAAAAAGAIFMVISGAHLLALSRISQFAKLLCGLGLTLSPFIFGYGGILAFAHMLLGPAMLALAALEIWQDWGLSDDQLGRYGEVAHHVQPAK